MSWVFWLVGYLLLLAIVLLFFAGISSSERHDEDAEREGRPVRVRPPKLHPSEPTQMELSLGQGDATAARARRRN